MRERGSPGALLFTGIGFWIVAWRLMPGPDWHLTAKLFVGLLTIVGALLVMSAVVQSARRLGPWWQGLAGRMIAVGLVWGTIISAASHYGTPHLLYEYPARQPVGTCIYVGWKGFVGVAAGADQAWNGCGILAWISDRPPTADRRSAD